MADRIVVLALVPGSEPGAFYVVTREGRAAACSCPAYRFARAAPKTCKHLRDLWRALNGEMSADDERDRR